MLNVPRRDSSLHLIGGALLLCLSLAYAQEVTSTDTLLDPLAGKEDSLTLFEILTPKDTDTTKEVSPLTTSQKASVQDSIIKKGLLLSVSWAFGGSDIVDQWSSSQQKYQDTARLFLDSAISPSSDLLFTVLEPPTVQRISFPFTIGYLQRATPIFSWGVSASYAYQGKGSSFVASELVTDTANDTIIQTEIYKYKNHLQNHQVHVGVSGEFLFHPDYLTIDRVTRSGISFSLAYIPLSLYISNTTETFNSLDTSFSQYGQTTGMGGSWGISLFGERQLSENVAGRLSIGYVGTFTGSYDDIASLLPTNTSPTTKTSNAEHLLQIGLTLYIRADRK